MLLAIISVEVEVRRQARQAIWLAVHHRVAACRAAATSLRASGNAQPQRG